VIHLLKEQEGELDASNDAVVEIPSRPARTITQKAAAEREERKMRHFSAREISLR